eukprot:TRINITY_DN5074_c0_g2_i2.p1 TRINITY_DN5074_c0_g2~~TRINITY_DN5074_c0_g2_i2.p1  ORF type:complete len:390 (+),score=75.06 TRINITY_DN5074_c0_g2_i2:67-1236(+)
MMMIQLRTLCVLLCALFMRASSQGRYAPCQMVKPPSKSPLDGCPPGTIFVSTTDPRAKFTSIQEAIMSLDHTSSHILLIAPGLYHEAINVSRPGPLTLLGQTNKPDDPLLNQVTIFNASAINANSSVINPWLDDSDTAVMTIAPNRAAALVGSGPTGAPVQYEHGNSDFKAYNLNIANTYADYSVAPSLALDASYSNVSLYYCILASYQDTLYVGKNATFYAFESIIKGGTDYLFGFGTAWLERCILANRECGGAITAWKGTYDTTTGANANGIYISHSRVVRADDAITTLNLTHACALGRPWNNASRAIYLNTYMDDTVRPQGFIPWSPTDPRIVANLTDYAEGGSYGPGYEAGSRAYFDRLLSYKEAAAYTLQSVFGYLPPWIDYFT